MKLFLILSLLAASAIAPNRIAASQKRYDGYQLFQVTPKDRASFDALIQLFEKSVEYDFCYDFNVITAFVNEIAAAHPNLVKVSSIGKTYKGRDTPLVKISSGGTGKKAIIVDHVSKATDEQSELYE